MLDFIDFDLSISRDELLRYYQGAASQVFTVARDGRSVRFPVGLLREFVNHSGVHGRFRLYHDRAGKFVRMERVGDI